MSLNCRSAILAKCLETLEDDLFTKKYRTQSFQNLHLILQDKDCSAKVTPQEVLRILTVFEKCLKLDIQSIPHALTTVLSLLTNVKVISAIPAQDLLSSALGILHMVKTLSVLETQHLRTMGLQAFLSYPVDVLTMIIRHNCSEVLEIFENFIPQIQQGETTTLHVFLNGLLMKLPPQEKKQLLQQGLPIWFKVIAAIMNVCAKANAVNVISLDYIPCLEVLTGALVDVNYFQCPQWQNEILKCICDTKMYPASILRQLQFSSTIWHRFWIVFVKLLKNQITRNSTYGTPIQPMLEVVETAFKMDSKSRCRAFQCWDVLIDSLSSDTNAKSIPRYLKLLLIPLKPNNAKTEDAAQAKFHTWWNLIRKFQDKLDRFTSEVLLEFLHYMFGKKAQDKKCVSVAEAGQAYDSVRTLCLQAFAEIVGHANCNCCTDLPNLNEKMLNNKLLASHWDEWMNALKKSILITNMMYLTDKDDIINKPMQVLCVWRAFVISIADLPSNGVRKDMFNELIQVLIDLLEFCIPSDAMPDILLSLTLSLTEDNESIRKLVASKGDDQPFHKIMSIIVNPKIHGVFERYETIEMVKILKPLTDFAVSLLNSNCCLNYLLHNSSSLKLWTALASSMNEAQILINVKTMREILMWPVLAMQKIDVDKYSATVWQTVYDTYTKKSSDTKFDRDIYEQIKGDKNSSYFKVIVAVSILKNTLVHPNEDIGLCIEILENVTAEVIPDYKLYKEALPVLVDTIVMMLDKISPASDEKLAEVSLNCVKNILLMFFSEIKSQDKEAGNKVDANIFVMLDNIFKALQPLNKIQLTSHIFCGFLGDLRIFGLRLNKESPLFELILSKINYLGLNSPIDVVKTKINECIDMLTENSKSDTSSDMSKAVKVFTSPNVNKVVKRSKKKEAVIINTVTENGEVYEVFKSNWKFNPKNLTENQKEKLQRKREDIPALYQDLSQSQDEFKLSKWKTDSQDTTTSSNSTSSKLTTNNEASNILQNIQSSDVVPNIIRNILSENDKKHTSGSNETCHVSVLQTEKSEKVARLSPSTPKNTKSPRMALKDRVFRNVRNLIEKSSSKNDTTDAIVGGCQTTPSAKSTNNANMTNSAPPLISAERPSRVKRIPKKFADVQLFGLKKRRYSQTDSQDDCNQDYNNEKTDKAMLGADNCNAVNGQHVVRNCDVKESESVKDAQELLVIPVSQHDSTKGVIDKIITDNLSGIQNNGNKLHNQKPHNDFNSDNNNEQQQQKEDSDNNVNTQDLELNDKVQFIAKEGVAQNFPENDCSQPCQQNNDAPDVQMDDGKNELTDKVPNAEYTGELNAKTDCNNKEITTLKTPVQKNKQASQKSTAKKSMTKKSRIEKELAIDMVEGHPFLNVQSEKRLTRKKLMETENVSKRKSVPHKSNKTKAETNNKKCEEKYLISNSQESSPVTVEETQERNTLPDQAPCSEDVIESSQDSNFTTVTVKPTKRTPKRQAVVSVERLQERDLKITGTQDLLQDSDCEMLCESNKSMNQETKDDIELPQNKTAEVDKNYSELTENMDTEPDIDENITSDVIIIHDDDRESPITVSSEKSVGLDTEELAEADTQPNDPADFVGYESNETSQTHKEIPNTPMDATESMSPSKLTSITDHDSQENVTESSAEPNCSEKETEICSPLKDDAQRKQDFLNNTSEISPIKAQSPDKDKTSPEKDEETSSDYLVVKLSSPVNSKGEPFPSKGSPEFFTDDKTSPDKRDQSPPRTEVIVSSDSPSSSLSLKKNRPQNLRPGGRAAHMVGLCVPDSINSKKNSEKVDPEEPKKPSTSTPARRNLRVLYNAVSDNSDTSEDKEQDNFLKLKKALPSVDSSPAVPILKRKIDIVDETASPASKRKRVSFHDPPVSTTVSVQKYIKPDCIESPNTVHKRLEVQMTRSLTKSPKRLDNAVKLDTVLSKAIESFTEQPVDSLTNDTNISLDVTPAVEVVNTSELNDLDPICPDLVYCNDPIDNIAIELSSPAMKDLLIKELDGKVLTVGDLAKMTELEVNRLCIKAPKVQVAKKVLVGYVNKRVVAAQDAPFEAMILADETDIATEMNEDMSVLEAVNRTVETQTDKLSMCETASQTRTEIVKLASTQTTSVSTVDTNTQTLESGYKPTSEIITSCLSEREDFIEKLSELLPTDTIIDILGKKSDDSKLILTKLLDRQTRETPNERSSKEFSLLKDFLLERFDHRDLILFCSRLFQGLYDKSA